MGISRHYRSVVQAVGSAYDERTKFQFDSCVLREADKPSTLQCKLWSGQQSRAITTPHLGASRGEDSFCPLNHAAPAGNAPAPQWRKPIRADNHVHWITKPGGFKRRWPPIGKLTVAVNHAGVSAKGFVWLTVSRRIPKAPSVAYSGICSSYRNPSGFLLATAATFPAFALKQ